jgi:hypothetical protein
MPFKSKKQWRWAFGTGQPFARDWAHKTGSYRSLPSKKTKSTSKGKRRRR